MSARVACALLCAWVLGACTPITGMDARDAAADAASATDAPPLADVPPPSDVTAEDTAACPASTGRAGAVERVDTLDHNDPALVGFEMTTAARDGEGRTYLVGGVARCSYSSSRKEPAVVRLLASGEVDRTFGRQGRVCVPSPLAQSGYTGFATDIALARDRVVIVGSHALMNSSLIMGYVAVLDLDGALDPGFAASGFFSFPYRPPWLFPMAHVSAVLADDEGMTLVGGDTSQWVLGSYGAVARLRWDGTLDPEFNHQSVLVDLESGGFSDVVRTSWGYVLAGSSRTLAPRLLAIDAQGRRVPWFGVGGAAQRDVPQSFVVRSIVVDPRGGYALAGAYGYSEDLSSLVGAVARVDAFGRFDATFGTDGLRVSPWLRHPSYLLRRTFARQCDGQLLLAATRTGLTSVLSRVTGDGRVDESFGDRGDATLSQTASETLSPTAVLVADDGHVEVWASSGAAAISRYIVAP
ncbi:MAG: hypothetical protein R3A52_27720 [Polyangiales bacterium]